MLGDIKLSELALIIELAETNSLRELARRQQIHPSQISKVIRRVEKRIGFNLFQRSSQRISFTIEGRHFLKTALKILEISSELAPKRKSFEERLSRIITISSLSYMNQYLIPECLKDFRKESKETTFRLLEIPNKDLIISGIRGYFEMSLHLKKLDWPKTWTTKKVGVLKAGLFARYGHSLGAKVSQQQLEKEKFVVPIRWTKNGLRAGEDNCPIPMKDRQHGDGAMTAGVALQIIQRSNQLAYLPLIVAKDYLRTNEIMQIEVDEWSEMEEALYLSVQSEKIEQKTFLNFAKQIEKRLSF